MQKPNINRVTHIEALTLEKIGETRNCSWRSNGLGQQIRSTQPNGWVSYLSSSCKIYVLQIKLTRREYMLYMLCMLYAYTLTHSLTPISRFSRPAFSIHFNGKILNSYAKSNNSHFDIDKSHFPFRHQCCPDAATIAITTITTTTQITINELVCRTNEKKGEFTTQISTHFISI